MGQAYRTHAAVSGPSGGIRTRERRAEALRPPPAAVMRGPPVRAGGVLPHFTVSVALATLSWVLPARSVAYTYHLYEPLARLHLKP